VEAAQDCAASADCRAHGACGHDPYVAPEACIATMAADCLGSEGCRTDGLCALGDDGACVTSEQGCRAGEGCAARQDCAPASARACGHTWADAVTWCDAPCAIEGACVQHGALCRAEREEDCRASAGCRDHGRCSLDAAGICVAAHEADCAASSACLEGAPDGSHPCTLRGERCADALSACARSDECLIRGDCGAREGTCAPGDDALCAASVECLTEGRCHHAAALCLPADDADCASSLACQAFGRCRLRTFLGLRFCAGPDGKSGPVYPCPAGPCLAEGRCLQGVAGVCRTPAELGLPDPLPRRPVWAPEPAPPVPLPAPVDGSHLDALLDGEPMTVRATLAGHASGAALWILLADRPLPCTALGAPESVPDEVSWVRLVLAPDLTGEAAVTHAAWRRAPGRASASGRGRFGGGLWGGAGLRLEVDATVMEASLALHGVIPAQGCEPLPPPTPARPQPDLRLEVAGQPVPVAMALVDRAFDQPIVVLASQPVTCQWRAWQTSTPDLLVELDTGGGAALGGARVAGTVGVWGRGNPPVLGPRDTEGAREVRLAFVDQGANPALRVTGTARAIDCGFSPARRAGDPTPD
ncbi:MAG: hypothetical protein ABIO70_20395, partial [Pseudomonadota bacterium]